MIKTPQASGWIRNTIFAVFLLFAGSARTADAPALDPAAERAEDRKELRLLLGKMEKAISDLDIEATLQMMTPTAVVTWQNAEVSRGTDAIRAYHQRMIGGVSAKVKKFSTKATLGGSAIFYGDSAIAYGTEVDTYELADGLSFSLHANWSTTVVKTDGQWKVAALHFSTNLFDNPLLNNAKKMVWIAALAALLGGVLLTLLTCRLWRCKPAVNPAP